MCSDADLAGNAGAPLPHRLNAAVLLVDAHVAAGRGERIAILAGEEAYSYGRLKQAVDRVGSALRRLGVERGDRVALFLPDGLEFAAAFLGAIKIGAVAVPVNPLLTAEEHRFVLEDSGASVLVASAELSATLTAMRGSLRSLRHTALSGNRGAAPDFLDFGEWLAGAAAELAASELAAADTASDDPAFWLYSSGTTGRPKAAVHLHRSMPAAADCYARPILKLGPDDVCFSVAKLFFAYGLGNALYFPLRVGAAAIHLPGRPAPQAVFESIERHRPTILFSVPSSYAALLAYAEERGLESLGRTRLAVSAGEPLPRAILERWVARFGVEVLDGIGSTEALHIFISNRSGQVRLGSTGLLVPGYQARIVDEAGRDVPAGEVGDLLVKGESVTTGYWNRPAETNALLSEGWLRTGDKFSVDSEGYYWSHGRADDMLKVAGQWVSPAEVEAALMEHPAVLECGVVGWRDQNELVKPIAYVVPREGCLPSDDLERDLKGFLKSKLAPHKRPHWVRFVAELPKTSTGKVQRFVLRARL